MNLTLEMWQFQSFLFKNILSQTLQLRLSLFSFPPSSETMRQIRILPGEISPRTRLQVRSCHGKM